MKTETPRDAALRIATKYATPNTFGGLLEDVEAALNAERERAVRLIDEHQALDVCADNCWTTIKEAIRGSKD